MSNSVIKGNGTIVTFIGIIVMTVLIVIKLFMPESLFSGYALIVGIAAFFIVETVNKTPDDQSGVRFSTIIDDLKKPQVLFWVLLPIVITVIQIVAGKLFSEDSYRKYIEHVIGRTSLEMDFSNFIKWIAISCITVLLGSAVLFALGHMATGDSAIVFFDLLGIFIDAIMYAIAFEKSGNSVISFIPHCLNNMLGLVLIRILFM